MVVLRGCGAVTRRVVSVAAFSDLSSPVGFAAGVVGAVAGVSTFNVGVEGELNGVSSLKEVEPVDESWATVADGQRAVSPSIAKIEQATTKVLDFESRFLFIATRHPFEFFARNHILRYYPVDLTLGLPET
jgi:hypothetical protein